MLRVKAIFNCFRVLGSRWSLMSILHPDFFFRTGGTERKIGTQPSPNKGRKLTKVGSAHTTLIAHRIVGN